MTKVRKPKKFIGLIHNYYFLMPCLLQSSLFDMTVGRLHYSCFVCRLRGISRHIKINIILFSHALLAAIFVIRLDCRKIAPFALRLIAARHFENNIIFIFYYICLQILSVLVDEKFKKMEKTTRQFLKNGI